MSSKDLRILRPLAWPVASSECVIMLTTAGGQCDELRLLRDSIWQMRKPESHLLRASGSSNEDTIRFEKRDSPEAWLQATSLYWAPNTPLI
jgi:hypothetical protein